MKKVIGYFLAIILVLSVGKVLWSCHSTEKKYETMCEEFELEDVEINVSLGDANRNTYIVTIKSPSFDSMSYNKMREIYRKLDKSSDDIVIKSEEHEYTISSAQKWIMRDGKYIFNELSDEIVEYDVQIADLDLDSTCIQAVPAFISEEILKEYLVVIETQNKKKFNKMKDKGEMIYVEQWAKCNFVEYGMVGVCVEVLEGEYEGEQIWVQKEFVQSNRETRGQN